MQSTNKNSYGCLFCRSGQEETTANELRTLYPEIEYIVPLKKRYRRMGKVLHEETVKLFSGYIFFRAQIDHDVYRMRIHKNVYRVLCDSEKDWRLKGSDKYFAEKLFAVNGVIGFSQAVFEGGKISFSDGFLCGENLEVLSINRRSKTVRVRMELVNEVFDIWLGYK